MLYDYPARDLDAARSPAGEEARFREFRVEYESLAPSHHPEANRVIGYLHLPRRPASARAAIVLHGMGRWAFRPVKSFARELARRDVPALFLVLPHHYERAPRGLEGGGIFLHGSTEETMRNFRQAVVDVRAGIDLLEREGFAADEFTVLGISLGAMIATIAMGVDGRIRNGVLVAGGGDLSCIVRHSILTSRMRREDDEEPSGTSSGRGRQRRRHLRRAHREYIRRLKTPTDLDRIEPADRGFLFDPLTFAHFIRGRKVVMYNAMFDPIIPHHASEELWEELGRPERHILLCDHCSIVLYRRAIVTRTARLIRGGR